MANNILTFLNFVAGTHKNNGILHIGSVFSNLAKLINSDNLSVDLFGFSMYIVIISKQI